MHVSGKKNQKKMKHLELDLGMPDVAEKRKQMINLQLVDSNEQYTLANWLFNGFGCGHRVVSNAARNRSIRRLTSAPIAATVRWARRWRLESRHRDAGVGSGSGLLLGLRSGKQHLMQRARRQLLQRDRDVVARRTGGGGVR